MFYFDKNKSQVKNILANSSYSKFRQTYLFESRLKESIRIRTLYPDRIPVICEKNLGSNASDIDKHKYLVPSDMQIYNFVLVVRKRMRINSSDSIFLFVGGNIPSSNSTFLELYDKYKNPDGYLYITYSKENVFG